MIKIVNTAEIDVLWVLCDIWEKRWEGGVLRFTSKQSLYYACEFK